LNFCTIQQWLSRQNEVIRVESARKKRVAVQRAALLSALLGDAEFVLAVPTPTWKEQHFEKGLRNSTNQIQSSRSHSRLGFELCVSCVELCRQENAQLDGLPTAQPDFSVCYLRVICCRAAFSQFFLLFK
jgi:hypothetical protein